MIFICPKCRGKLTLSDGAYKCENNHSYDVAKEGYVHLLPVNKMHSKLPGDSKEMVNARHDFLSKGYYDMFADTLCSLALKYSDGGVIFDAGCGEGYYLRRLEQAMTEHFKNCEYYGLDISKIAVRIAAKKQKSASFAVGSIFDLPAESDSVDLLINIFAPMVEGELCRVLKKGSVMLYAVPTENHLFALKEVLYDEPYLNTFKETSYDGFEFVERVKADCKITLSNDDIMNLFAMTPYYLKTSREGAERLKSLQSLTTEAGFYFLVYRKA